MSNISVQRICITCTQSIDGSDFDPDAVHDVSDESCPACKEFTKEGYIFVSISDKSEAPARIRRTGYTWKVEEQEVINAFGEESDLIASGERIVFLRSTEALQLGLLTQEQYDDIEQGSSPESGSEQGQETERDSTEMETE